RDRLHTRLDHPDWPHIAILGGSVKPEELTDAALPLDDIIWRLFHDEDEVRTLSAITLSRGCRCDPDYVRSVIARFPAEEREAMVGDDGVIRVDCAFCSSSFAIEPKELSSWVRPLAAADVATGDAVAVARHRRFRTRGGARRKHFLVHPAVASFVPRASAAAAQRHWFLAQHGTRRRGDAGAVRGDVLGGAEAGAEAVSKRAIVLLSGGLDSMVCAGLAREAGFSVTALTLDYGQRHRVELQAARAIAAGLADKHIVLPLDLRAVGGPAVTD